jgi:hypothetical protein
MRMKKKEIKRTIREELQQIRAAGRHCKTSYALVSYGKEN